MTELAESTARFLGLETADLNRGAPILDFVKTAWLSIALLIVRVISERVCIPILASVIKDGPKRTVSRQVFDDSFIAFFSALLEALAIVNTVLYNGGCTPWSTDACMIGWPGGHTLVIMQRLYFVLMFQYYLYEMVGTVVGMGTMLKTEMVVHHVATMALISLSYRINLVRYGTMWMALFDLSNPLLHTAKVVHALKVPVLKDTMLPLFALVFFVARVAAAPFSILRPAFTHAIHILPTAWAATFIGLMIFICVLQLFWFYKIVNIAMRGDSKALKYSQSVKSINAVKAE